MSSGGKFADFIQARDAAGLQVYMSNELLDETAHLERNNRVLFESCRDGCPEICQVLISFGADVNSAVVDSQTPLYIACFNAHPACVVLLLAHGASVDVGDFYDGLNPLIATGYDCETPDGLTLDQFIDNRCRCMSTLLSAGAEIDHIDYYGDTALTKAIWNIRLTKILIEAGANVNILNKNHNSSILMACWDGHVDVVEPLLEYGADINAVNKGGRTPLHYACPQLFQEIVELLLRYGADIDIMDNSGNTALDITLSRRANTPDLVAVMQLMATCAQTRLEACFAEWIRLAQN